MSQTGPRPAKATPAEVNATAETMAALLKPFHAEAALTRAAIEDRSRMQRRLNHWVIGFLAGTVVLVILVLVILIQTARASSQIAGCTTPGGRCYEEGRVRTGTAVQQLVTADVVIVKCARATRTDDELDACLRAHLPAAPASPAPHHT